MDCGAGLPCFCDGTERTVGGLIVGRVCVMVFIFDLLGFNTYANLSVLCRRALFEDNPSAQRRERRMNDDTGILPQSGEMFFVLEQTTGRRALMLQVHGDY